MSTDLTREMMRRAAAGIQADLARDLFLGNATTCAPSPPDESLTADGLLDTINLFRARCAPSPSNPLGPIMGLRTTESPYLTVSRERWVRVRRSWRARLYGGRLLLWRAGAMLIVFLLAATVSPWLALALPVLSLRPRRWRVSHQPRKICEQVPDPSYYVMSGTIMAHPATMGRLLAELAKMEQQSVRAFARARPAPRPKMTRAEYRRAFGVTAT